MPRPQIYTEVVGRDGGALTDSAAGAFKTIQAGSSGGVISVTGITVQASVAVASSGAVNGTTIVNPGARGAMLILDVDSEASSAAASPTLDIKVQGVDPATSSFFDLPGAAFEQVTTSTTMETLTIHPGVPADSGEGFKRAPGVLPPSWRVQWTAQSMASGSTGATYEFTVGAVYIP